MSDEALVGLVGVVLGFALNEGKALFSRWRIHRGYWRSLQVEVEFSKDRVEGFLNDNVQAPLYRLPDFCFQACFPQLLASGAVGPEDAAALMTFYSELATFNRGLDRAADAETDERRREEDQRNRMKGARLVKNGAAYQAARLAIESHIN